jgi:cytoskeletal protein CcmA (bactofilin family)
MAEDSKSPPQFPNELGNRVLNIPASTRSERLPGSPGEGRRLIVGREICLSGEITECDTLVVEGQVEANLNDSHRIEITESGYFKGKVDIAIAEIRGHFEGQLIARERLIIYKTGRVTGTVACAEIEIERGGIMSGEVDVAVAAETQNVDKNDNKTPDVAN